MKSNLINRTLTTVLTAAGLTMFAATVHPADANPKNTSPVAPPTASPAVDPNTGLPLPPSWMDPSWPDPDKTLPDFTCDGIPVREVGNQLRAQFKDAFDVLIPNGWQDPNNPSVSIDLPSIPIRMQLKNVRASEVFHAMNLMFDAENTPCRWELKLAGNRPVALLRALPDRIPVAASPPPPRPTSRMVYFVGDLIDDRRTGGMTMESLVKTVSEVFQLSYGRSNGVLQFHKEAQLLVVTGSIDQLQFAQQTIAALREKAGRAEARPLSAGAEPKTHPGEPKPR